ncbi:MAG TPA: nuclear transport factor 2 family protein, partial [Steroidobacteraceae bacterium]|nr:nuclear transport factor 2 family protein [Steroidobacteraceae bacterium]
MAAGAADAQAKLERFEIDIVRAEDVRAIKKLQRAYGYYADRGLWNDLADLFAEDAVANYPSGGFDGNASIRAMFVQNLGQGREGLAEGRIYNHTILQPVVDLAADGATATGRWRVLGMLGRFGGSATWADSLYRFDYVKQGGHWKIKALTAYAGSGGGYEQGWIAPKPRPPGYVDTSPVRFNLAHPADRP